MLSVVPTEPRLSVGLKKLRRGRDLLKILSTRDDMVMCCGFNLWPFRRYEELNAGWNT